MLPLVSIDPSLLRAWTAVVENMPDAMFVVSGAARTGQIAFANIRAVRMFGYGRNELVNQSIVMLLPPQERAQHREPLHPGAGQPMFGRHRDGAEFPIDVLFTPNEGSAAPVTILMVRYLTDRKQLDSSLQSDEVKSRYLAAATHNLRHSLQTIWNLQAVLAQTFKHTEYALHMTLLEEAVRKMDQMLTSLVDINRSEFEGGATSGAAADLAESPDIIASPDAGAIKVLHIEDDRSVSRSMARLLRLEGYEVVSASSREEALQHLEAGSLRPDLILTDFQFRMGFTGEQIVAEIAARLGFRPPTIMLTSANLSKHLGIDQSIADRILPKPVDINVLLSEIECLLGKSAVR
jgi:PAS domain S-box-containing protein